MAYTVHVELELEPHSQPIAGVLATQSLPNRPFDGWMELASSIQDALTAAIKTTPQERHDTSNQTP